MEAGGKRARQLNAALERHMIMKAILTVLVCLSLTCTALNASAQEPDSTALFFVLGMLNDYIGRDIYRGDSLAEVLYPHEKVVGDIFMHYLGELNRDMRYNGTIKKEIQKQGHIAFYSKEIASAIDSCFVFDFSDSSNTIEVQGRWLILYVARNLKREIFPSLWNNRTYAFAFLRGVYLRNSAEDILVQLGLQEFSMDDAGRDPLKRAHLTFANSFYKESLTQFLLYHYGCENIAVIDKTKWRYAPGVIGIYFDPSPAFLSEVILRQVAEYSAYMKMRGANH